jgi:hypothetical protein
MLTATVSHKQRKRKSTSTRTSATKKSTNVTVGEQHLCQPPNCNQLTISHDMGRAILARLVSRVLPFYKSITKEQFHVLQSFKYGYLPSGKGGGTFNQLAYNFNINEFLHSETYNIDSFHLFYNKELFTILQNTDKLIDPKYKDFAKYMQLSHNTSKEYIINYINRIVSHSVNTLTSMFTNPHMPHLSYQDTVYRGLRNCHVNGKKVGDTVIFNNFMYTSVSCNIAFKFGSKFGQSERICICKLVGLYRVPFIHILNDLDFTYESRIKSILNSSGVIDSSTSQYEILLQRNNQFKIIDITTETLYGSTVNMYTMEFLTQLRTPKINKKHVAAKELSVTVDSDM